MIITRLMGGHSNQLFQYAVGRRLALAHNTDLKLDLTWFDETFDPGTTPRFYELSDYPIKAKFASKLDLARVEPPDGQARRPLGKLKRKLNRGADIKRITETGLGIDKAALNARDDSFLVGYWQNENYFKDIRPVLLEEFEPIAVMSDKNKNYLKKIRSCEAISLHVRREDYVTNPNANAFHGLTDMDHYLKSVELIKRKSVGKSLEIFVFCKEIDWCKANLEFDLPTTFIEGNKKGSEDMRLMKHCKHNIMANSSFSWWGAWLNQNPKKIVIAPKTWFQDEKANKEIGNVPKEWIRL
jgi:hypothetical protein